MMHAGSLVIHWALVVSNKLMIKGLLRAICLHF